MCHLRMRRLGGRGQVGAAAAAVLNTNRTYFNTLSEFITAIEIRQMLKYFCIQAKTCVNINICEYDKHTCIYMYGI